jgi:hypothetical protein
LVTRHAFCYGADSFFSKAGQFSITRMGIAGHTYQETLSIGAGGVGASTVRVQGIPSGGEESCGTPAWNDGVTSAARSGKI